VPEPPGLEEILSATFDLFLERGYAGFSMEDVAARADVELRQVLALGSRPEIVVRAVDRFVPRLPPCPDTGSLRSDLIELFDIQRTHLRENRAVLDVCIRTIQSVPEYAQVGKEITHDRIEDYRPVYERARARDELDPEVGFDAFIDIVQAPILAHFINGDDVDDEVPADRVVAMMIEGLATRRAKPDETVER
jgi:AcrR family transcriptional regulator